MEKDTVMKDMKLVSLVLLSVLISISCRLFVPGSSNDNSTVPNDSVNTSGIDFTTPAEPQRFTVEVGSSQDFKKRCQAFPSIAISILI